MQTPIVPAPSINMVGLSWHISAADGANHEVKIIEHAGGTSRQRTRLVSRPKTRRRSLPPHRLESRSAATTSWPASRKISWTNVPDF